MGPDISGKRMRLLAMLASINPGCSNKSFNITPHSSI
jgi:hypothetical protein